MLSIFKIVGRSPLIPPCRCSIVNNRVWQPSIFHRAQSSYSNATPLLTGRAFPSKHKGFTRHRSLCTWDDQSHQIKILKRQRLFLFGVGLAASGAISWFFADKVLLPFTRGAITAASWHDKLVRVFQNEMYSAISSRPEIMSKIGSNFRIDRPFVDYRTPESSTVYATLSNDKGDLVGEVRMEMPMPVNNNSAGTEAERNLHASRVDCDVEVRLELGTFKFRAAVPRGARVEEEGHEFDLDLEEVEEAALINDDDEVRNR